MDGRWLSVSVLLESGEEGAWGGGEEGPQCSGWWRRA